MQRNSFVKHLLLVLMVAVFFTTCKRDDAPEPCMDVSNPNCVNYNPCYGVQSVTADFEMWAFAPGLYEQLRSAGRSTDEAFLSEDSIFQPTCIYFKAKLRGANYLWQLGSQTITDSGDYRYFVSVGNPGIYRVYYNSLTVTKQPNYSCFPQDTNYATQTRSLRIVKPSQLLTSGAFKVKYEGQQDSIVLQILTWNSASGNTKDTLSEGFRLLIGFPETVRDSMYIAGDYYMNKIIMFDKSPILRPYNGFFKVSPADNSVMAEYDQDVEVNGVRIKKHYRCAGRKIK
jgi:hypothetical protein